MAGLPATPVALPGTAPAAASARAPRAPTCSAPTPASDDSPPARTVDGKPADAPATGKVSGKHGADRRADDDGKDDGKDFAGLMSDHAAADAPTVVSKAAGDAPAKPANDAASTTAPASPPPACSDTPAQLLALLTGAWLPTAAAAATTAVPTLADPLPGLPAGTDAVASAASAPTAAAASAAATSTSAHGANAAAPAPGASASSSAAGAQGADAAIAGAFAQALDVVDTRVDPASAPGADGVSAVDTLASALPTAALAAPLRGVGIAAAANADPLAMPADADAGFDDAFGARIGWLAEQRIGHADIRVSPDRFGTIDVRLQLDGNRVSAEFHASHAEVRHTLEAGMDRLRDLLGQQGLQLAHADVGQRRGGTAASPSHDRPAGSGETHDGDGHAAAAPLRAVVHAQRLLDAYA